MIWGKCKTLLPWPWRFSLDCDLTHTLLPWPWRFSLDYDLGEHTPSSLTMMLLPWLWFRGTHTHPPLNLLACSNFPLWIFQASNLIYVDQPTGTGFSYSTDPRDIRFNEKGVSDDVYDFLQVWYIFKNEHILSIHSFFILSFLCQSWPIHSSFICFDAPNSFSFSWIGSLGVFQGASKLLREWVLYNWRIICRTLYSSCCWESS